jgi:ATP-binding cassette subfamily B multidrug efflux pump
MTAFELPALSDWCLGLPLLVGFLGYVLFLRHFVRHMRNRAKVSEETRSHVTARVVGSYANTLSVKLFARLADEDAYAMEVIDERQGKNAVHIRLISKFMFALALMNAELLTVPVVI